MFNWFVTNRQLKNEIADLRRDWLQQQLEWESVYEKFRRLLARLSRRDERDHGDAERGHASPGLQLADGNGSLRAGELTAEQQQANDEILARRGKKRAV